MPELRDLEALIRSRTPILIVESAEETRVLDLFARVSQRLPATPLFVWSVTEGLRRIAEGYGPQRHNAKPAEVLAHIRATDVPGIFVLLDFHPYLQDPVHLRLLKEVALKAETSGQTVILLSHAIEVPPELRSLSAAFQLRLPDEAALQQVVTDEIERWEKVPAGSSRTDLNAVSLLVRNLAGLTLTDARRLARQAIRDDGAVTSADLPAVMRAKYELMGRDGVLSFEFDTARFSDIGGLQALKRWLGQRKSAFLRDPTARGLDVPRGILLLGVQGCGKSLAAKAVAGSWGVPLLRLDCGALYDKFIGETERNLRSSLRTSEVLAPCVLWIDEIEKGLGIGDHDGGTSRRVLGSLLTWMAENAAPVFLVATANDIEALPPELVRKGRVDEIFFVDLPSHEVRQTIFDIHLCKRDLQPGAFDLRALADATGGFSGAEIEQVVVSALYAAHAQGASLATPHLLSEIERTRPLSVVLGEKIASLRQWARDRTVPAD